MCATESPRPEPTRVRLNPGSASPSSHSQQPPHTPLVRPRSRSNQKSGGFWRPQSARLTEDSARSTGAEAGGAQSRFSGSSASKSGSQNGPLSRPLTCDFSFSYCIIFGVLLFSITLQTCSRPSCNLSAVPGFAQGKKKKAPFKTSHCTDLSSNLGVPL